jgi:hypothetical protein
MAAVSLVLAAGHHPLALGMGLGALPLLIPIHRAQGGRALKRAALIGLVVACPRLFRILSLALCGEGIGPCLARVAQSNVSAADPWVTLLRRAIHDRWLVDMGTSAWILLAGLLISLGCRQRRLTGLFVALGTLGILMLGLSQGYIRSYHLRITAVPLAVAAAIGLARLAPIALIAAAFFVFKTAPLLPVGPDTGAVLRHDRLAAALPEGPLWVDRVWWDGPPRVDPSAVVLSAWLTGRHDFLLGPTTPMLLLESGLDLETSAQNQGWAKRIFDNKGQARTWLNAQNRLPHQTGGAYDWATIADPETRLEDARW